MNDLIKALTILAKYMDENEYNPTHCEHDVLQVVVDPKKVSPEDIALLGELGFFPYDDATMASYRFGSA